MIFNYDIDLSSTKTDFDTETLKDEMNKIYKKIVNRIEKITILKHDVGIGTRQNLDEFISNSAGLFVADILKGFASRGYLKPGATVTKTKDTMNESEFLLHGNLTESASAELGTKPPAKFVLSQAGGLDQTKATQIFNEVMGDI